MVSHSGTPSRPHELRPLNLPQRLSVELDPQGEPVALRRNGRRLAVVAIQEVWRIDDEWWREPISRRYYRVLLEQGSICTIYHDLLHDSWYEQRA